MIPLSTVIRRTLTSTSTVPKRALATMTSVRVTGVTSMASIVPFSFSSATFVAIRVIPISATANVIHTGIISCPALNRLIGVVLIRATGLRPAKSSSLALMVESARSRLRDFALS